MICTWEQKTFTALNCTFYVLIGMTHMPIWRSSSLNLILSTKNMHFYVLILDCCSIQQTQAVLCLF